MTATTTDPDRTPSPDDAAPGADARVRRAGVRGPASGVVTVVRRGLTVARRGTASLVARVPGTLRTTRTGAQEATNALQGLPDPTLRTLAASSLGLGAGFYLTGAPRLAIVAGVVPAVMMAAAIALRPVAPLVPSGADR
jgi:hypothetical protein